MPKLKKIAEKIGQIMHTRTLVIIFIVGIALLILPTEKGEKDSGDAKGNQTHFAYKSDLESELENMLSGVKGVGKTHVMITFSDSGKTFYVADEQTEGKTETSEKTEKQTSDDTKYVLKNDAGGGQSPLISRESMPEVSGVLVIAPGAKDPKIKSEIIGAVRAVLGVKAHRVEVLEKK